MPLLGIFAKIFKMNFENSSSRKLFSSFIPAFKGIGSAFRSEKNLRFHFIAVVCVVFLGFVFDISIIEWLLSLVLFAIVIAMELINTAIEKFCDLVQPEKDDRIRVIKDISASAVLWASLMAGVAGLLIFVPKISIFVNNLQ